MRRRTTYTRSLPHMPLSTTDILRTTVAIALILPCSGCIFAGGRTVRDVGPRITTDSTAFVVPGKTSVDAVVAAFGEPNNRACTRDGAEILRYDCDVRTTEGFYFLGLFASSNNRIERTCWWFEARGDTVTRIWCDKCSQEAIANRQVVEPLPRIDFTAVQPVGSQVAGGN
jgi:hypothetical protein